jgi:hypothetical protein
MQADDVDTNNNESFLAGGLFEGSGIDFLELKELGLDFDIPARLLMTKSSRPPRFRDTFLPNYTEEGDVPTDSHEVVNKLSVPPWEPIDPNAQIGLLQPFFMKLLQEDPELLEVFKTNPG